jgi:hypothetical protein
MKPNKVKVLYILGGGHSGSTVLSLILGTAPQVFNAGELKLYNQHYTYEWDKEHSHCMCGETAIECPFWKRVAELSPDLEIFYDPGVKGYLRQFAKLLFPSKNLSAEDDYVLIKNTLLSASEIQPSVKFILDISKSLPRLMHLRSHPELELHPIFLVRDGRGYLNSYRKRHGDRGGLRWIVQWIAINLSTLITLYLNKERFLKISYNNLCRSPEQTIDKINQFFGIEIPQEYLQAINETEFHVRAANPKVLEQKYFSGLELDEKWKTELPTHLRLLASILIVPLNKIFSI